MWLLIPVQYSPVHACLSKGSIWGLHSVPFLAFSSLSPPTYDLGRDHGKDVCAGCRSSGGAVKEQPSMSNANKKPEWLAEYLKCLLPPTPEDLNIRGAQLLKLANLPSSLFRYRCFPPVDKEDEESEEKRKKILKELKTGQIRLTSPDAFNDPYDSAFTVEIKKLLDECIPVAIGRLMEEHNLKQPLTADEISLLQGSESPLHKLGALLLSKDSSLSKEKIKGFLDHMEAHFAEQQRSVFEDMGFNMRKGLRVCSFSANNRSLLMWSHYADQHRGLCIEYDVSSLPPDDERRYALCPVIYADRFFDAGEYFRDAMQRRDFNNLWLTIACSHKAPEWSYEEEWRLILSLGPNEESSVPVPMPIKAVYLGSRMKAGTEETIRKAGNQLGLPLYRMRLAKDSFRLGVEAIDTNG
jgi:hypothetical protein